MGGGGGGGGGGGIALIHHNYKSPRIVLFPDLSFCHTGNETRPGMGQVLCALQ